MLSSFQKGIIQLRPGDVVMALHNAEDMEVVSAVGFNFATSSIGAVNLVNILYVSTAESYQQRGLATALFDQITQRVTPREGVPLLAIHAAIRPGTSAPSSSPPTFPSPPPTL